MNMIEHLPVKQDDLQSLHLCFTWFYMYLKAKGFPAKLKSTGGGELKPGPIWERAWVQQFVSHTSGKKIMRRV